MGGRGFPRPYGKYELLSPLGEGGMGRAFRARARDPAGGPGLPVVIKTIQPGLARNAKLSRMFIEEAHLVARLEHPNIVRVFDLAQTDEGELYMALEYVDGVDLRDLLEHSRRLHIEAPIWFYLHVISEVLSGLAHAHAMLDEEGRRAPIIHRDVTPSNVLLSVEGEIKLSDFGIAVRADQTSSGNRNLTGKVAYMAPETLEGRPLDERADLFSVGVVLWECLTLRPLFAAGTDFDSMLAITQGPRTPPSQVNPRIPIELDEIVLRALESDPARRHSSALELRQALLGLLDSERPLLQPDEVRHVANVLMGREHPTGSFTVSEDLAAEAAKPKDPSIPPPWRLEIPPASTIRMAPAVLSDLVLSSVRATLPPVPVRPSRGPCISLRQSDGRTISPLAPLDALNYLVSQDIVAVSVDGQTWLDRETAVDCAGAPDLLPRTHPLEARRRGPLGPTSALSVLASLGLEAATGRLFLQSPVGGRFEIDVFGGRPTFVRSDDPNLRTHLVLTRSGLLPAAEVENMIEASLSSGIRIETRVAQAKGIEPDLLRSLVLKQELATPLALEAGHYAFDPQLPPRRTEPGRDELAPLLLGALELGLSEHELIHRLHVETAGPFIADPALSTVLAQLPLGAGSAQAMRDLADGFPLSEVTRRVPPPELGRFLAAVYLVREIGLLQPRF